MLSRKTSKHGEKYPVPVPVRGISAETLIRDTMDLDSWIVSTGAGQAAGVCLTPEIPSGGLSFRRGG